MLSVGAFAKRAKISSRTVRHYESLGLLPPARRTTSNYRAFDEALLERVARIRELQDLGFSLEDIKEILDISPSQLINRLEKRLSEVNKEAKAVEARKLRLTQILSVSCKVKTGRTITFAERILYMEAIREELINGLERNQMKVTENQLSYLEREKWFHWHPQMEEYIAAIKRALAFAQEQNLTLGPGRGSASSSLALYALGVSKVNPLEYGMMPERLTDLPPFVHIDVEFERGQAFVDYCRELTQDLSFGEIQGFKMPLIDIVNSVQNKVGRIDYSTISEDSDLVLGHFRSGDIAKIFQFDFSPQALVMKYEDFLPEYHDLTKMTQYLQSQNIESFRDIINITALWHPRSPEKLERIARYPEAKAGTFKHECLSDEMQVSLKENFGMIIYHEDLIRIIGHYTGWDFSRCNSLRRACAAGAEHSHPDWASFNDTVPPRISKLVLEESPWTFCLPHVVAFSEFTKKTCIFKSLHKEVYFREIESFEQKHGFKWDDIGVRLKGVSLLQG